MIEKPKISCVLITKEAQYPEIILERLDQNDFFDEILIQADCQSVFHRYIAANAAKNDIIYVQDDDCLVNFQRLFRHYDGRITNAMPKDFQKKYSDLQCTLVGWGCFFPKSMLGVFDQYVKKFGHDQHLLREADRIFTHLNQPFNTITLPHEDLFQTPDRMSFHPDHYTSAIEAIVKAKSLIMAVEPGK